VVPTLRNRTPLLHAASRPYRNRKKVGAARGTIRGGDAERGMSMTSVLGLVIIAAAVYAVLRRVDVRLALGLAALGLGLVAGVAAWWTAAESDGMKPLIDGPARVLRTFLTTMADEKFVIPLCCAMGFARVLAHTGCDRHLVQLLVRPLRRVRFLLLPGAVLVGFAVNIPVISQTSTAATVGPVLVPLLQASRVSPATSGAALLLGASVGGELLNPGAPEIRSVVEKTDEAAANLKRPPVGLRGTDCARRVLPLAVVQLAVATLVFWLLNFRGTSDETVEEPPASFCVNPVMALVPLVPVALLFATTPTFGLLRVPPVWLVTRPDLPADLAKFDSRLIGAAMLVGVAVATLVSSKSPSAVAAAFFEGAGYAYAHIISLIVVANCFGDGVRQIGLAGQLGGVILAAPSLMLPLAALVTLLFAWLCGSGMAATQSLFDSFAGPALQLGIDPAHAGAVVSLSAAAGRTMSPVAAVTLMCARLTECSPMELMKRVAIPLLAAVAAMVATAVLIRP
jgi:C4-dicarboxylate transporter, DcuC family